MIQIAVMDYSEGNVDVYENVDIAFEDSEKIENFLGEKYNLDEIYYMTAKGSIGVNYFN